MKMVPMAANAKRINMDDSGGLVARSRGIARTLNEEIGFDVFDTEVQSLVPGLCLKQSRPGHVDAGACVLDHHDAEARLAKIACGEEAADVRRDAAYDHGCEL